MSNQEVELERRIKELRRMVEREVSDVLPRKVGVLAVQHFRQNFRDSGFRDGGLRPWKKSQRELAGGRGASSRYKTLTSARNHLMSSIQARPGHGEVAIENPVPYATLHNEGGTLVTSPSVTPQMRKFAWAMVYKLSGRKRRKSTTPKRKRRHKPAPPLPPEAEKWKALALTRKTKLHIRAKIPKRQFIGESRELTAIVTKEINDSIHKIQKQIQDGISTL